RSPAASAAYPRGGTVRADPGQHARGAREPASGNGADGSVADTVLDDDVALRFSRRHRSTGVSQDAAVTALAFGDRPIARAGAVDDRVAVDWLGRDRGRFAADRMAVAGLPGLRRLCLADQLLAFCPG